MDDNLKESEKGTESEQGTESEKGKESEKGSPQAVAEDVFRTVSALGGFFVVAFIAPLPSSGSGRRGVNALSARDFALAGVQAEAAAPGKVQPARPVQNTPAQNTPAGRAATPAQRASARKRARAGARKR